ncbi:uncharacterized protein LOC136078426 [Hydra vulgaris]|uniref:Uncharacterized protein LOC136078426 n=1 Tax=Hydra vulgaris TaxID=6087 RepID=A0ABM4BMG2_HYDVU
MQKVKHQIRVLEDSTGESTVDKEEICRTLNDYFQSVFVIEPQGPMPDFKPSTEVTCTTQLIARDEASLSKGEVPNNWKCSNVTPIFKKGSKLKTSNYRPISLTGISCEVMERFVRDKILNYCIINSLISKNQHGFVYKKLCMTNLLETLDLLTEAMFQGCAANVIFTDLAKAFNKVPRNRLLQTIQNYGIKEELHAWIKAWLSGRQ